ncbi:hypothetical protein GE09DRAFT_1118636 [Coniochaeta sp. 2T2.1]|nr:hypothetical protein GE09DRAFT_1118636 [Coniochaeta sp. 2T2.1]
MEATSPTKRRVLGSLDPNASPRPNARLDAKQVSNNNAGDSPLKKVAVFSASPSSQPAANKRPLLFGELPPHGDLLHPAKKVCQKNSRRDMAGQQSSPDGENGRDQINTAPERRQSASPEPSSVFDTSALDTSQATNITEPDVVAITAAAAAAVSTLGPIPRSPTRPRLTREKAREKAEILKLRLGLASYKLRTNQTDIPLDQLELQSAKRHRSSSSRSNGAGWASSRLQSQLQLQRAQLAAGATMPLSPTPATLTRQSSSTSNRRPLPAAPVRRSSDLEEVDADKSFSSQIQWSQGSEESQHGLPGDGTEWKTQLQKSAREQAQIANAQAAQQTTPRRQFRVVEGVEEEDRLTSSALRGGAASGLLSLAQARS